MDSGWDARIHRRQECAEHCRRGFWLRGDRCTCVGRFQRQHTRNITVRVVVSEHSLHFASPRSKVRTRVAKVSSSGCCSVVDIEWVRDTVAVSVCGVVGPRGGNELHGSYRVVEHGITIEHAMIGVPDQCGADAVQCDADDPWGGQTVGEEHRTGEAAMIGFDASDRRQQGPREIAGCAPPIGQIGGVLVRP